MKSRLPILKLFDSNNNYFDQKREVLQANREHIRYYLTNLRGYNPVQVSLYLAAYDYFVNFPLEYDGATMTEDLTDIGNLELCSMYHDYLYIYYNCAGDFSYRWRVDKLFRHEMSRMGKSSWNRTVRFCLLTISAIFHTPYSYFFKDRKMTKAQKISVDGILTVLNRKFPRVWFMEFKPEMSLIVALIFLITFILS